MGGREGEDKTRKQSKGIFNLLDIGSISEAELLVQRAVLHVDALKPFLLRK